MSKKDKHSIEETRAEYYPSGSIAAQTQVTNLTVGELKQLIREVVSQTLTEMLADPDEGLELREDVREMLLQSVETTQVGVNTVSANNVAEALGLKW